MSAFPIIKITPDEVASYQITSGVHSDYTYATRWYHAAFEEYLPVISSFRIVKNFSVPTDEFEKNQIQSQKLLSNPNILPLSVRYIDEFGSYYIERPPFKVKINYKNARAMYSGPVVDDLEIWIPWTLMVIPASFYNHFDPTHVRMYYSHKPLQSLEDNYLYSFLPNAYSHGAICWSQSFQKLISLDQTKNQISSFDATYWHSMIINDYMMGGWNNDLQSRNTSHLFQHGISLSYLNNTSFNDEQSLLNAVPMIHKYIHMEKYPDLCSKINGMLINKFGYSKEQADYITNFDSLLLRSTRRRRGTNANNDQHGYEYSKILSFFSTLSLSETLEFYSQHEKYLKSASRSDRYSFYNTSISFEDIIAETSKEIDIRPEEIPLNLPISSVTKDNIEMFELSSSNYKSILFYFVLVNTGAVQRRKIHEYSHYPSSLISQLFSEFNIDISQFLNLLDNSEDIAKNGKIYVSVDAKTSQIAIHDKKYFSDLFSTIAQSITEKVQQYELLPKSSADRKRYERYSYHVQSINLDDQV